MNTSRLNAEFHLAAPSSPQDGQRHAAEARSAAGQDLARRFGDALARAAAWFRRGSVMAELNRLDDRELADIGLTRGNFSRVFDQDFAREHARRGY